MKIKIKSKESFILDEVLDLVQKMHQKKKRRKKKHHESGEGRIKRD